MRVLRSASVALPVLAVACASSTQEGPAEIVPTGSSQPQLVGCTAYTPPQTPWIYANRVWVEVTVLPDGRVDAAASRPKQSRYTRGDRAAILRAVDMAGTCSFEPVDEATTTTIQVAFN